MLRMYVNSLKTREVSQQYHARIRNSIPSRLVRPDLRHAAARRLRLCCQNSLHSIDTPADLCRASTWDANLPSTRLRATLKVDLQD